jgi:4-diphosphocytidyl-2-C-methyl-D-erythritol kinase
VSIYEAPAKLNLSLHVSPPRQGYHPLVSLVQTVEWCDRLELSEGEGSDALEITGRELEADDNLVMRALTGARRARDFPPQSVTLHKELPVASGLGGGSSDAAAALVAAQDLSGLADAELTRIAAELGADVPLFLSGGTLLMSGFGEEIERARPLDGVAFAIVVPDFGLGTAEVYDRWDTLEGPLGEPVPDDHLPPALRGDMPMRNDLLPAAVDLEPRLGDFIADVRGLWGTSVCLTGSGSACFGYFANLDEAADAASTASPLCSVALGVDLRDHGVARK